MAACGPGNYHEDWDEEAPDETPDPNFTHAAASREKCVVKLQFDILGGHSPGKSKEGTGFYINIPSPDYDLILTAGHNLIDDSKQRSQNLKILGDNILVEEKDVRINASYMEEPDESNGLNDYGAILLKKAPTNPRSGFGFSLKHAFQKEVKEDLYVCGFPAGEDLPTYSSGKCVRWYDNQLWYDAKTSKGMSGSPVFVAYKGKETAVAIHNYGLGPTDTASKGSRISLKLLRDVCGWVGLSSDGKSLKVTPKKPLAYDMRLCFAPDNREGLRVTDAKLTTGPLGPETKFDILPVYAPPGKPNKEYARHAFYFKKPLDGQNSDPWEARWVAWDPERGNATLSSDLRDRCLVKFKGKKTIQVIFAVDPADEKTWKVLVMKMKLKSWDLNMLKKPGVFRDTSEIYTEPFEGGKPKQYNEFSIQS